MDETAVLHSSGFQGTSSFPANSGREKSTDIVQERRLIIDLDPLFPVPKLCPEPEEQLPNESRKMWQKVTEAIHAKDYTLATTLKQEIEENQRVKAAARLENETHWKPYFFEDMHERIGQPHLSEEGRKALQRMHEGNFKLEPYEVL